MSVTAAAREFVITYGSYVVGGASASAACEVHGYPTIEMSRDRASVSFDVTVTAGTEAQAASAFAALEAAFHNPFQNLTIALGSSTLLSVTQAASTALDAIATVALPGGPPDTGRSRRYRVRIEFGLPATWAATSGLRDSSVALGIGPNGVATVTLRGTFTAVGSSDAKAVYDAAIASWASSQLSWLGISVYELIAEPRVQVSINRKTCDFERVYRELIYPQAGSSNDSAIVGQGFVVTKSRKGSEYSPSSEGGDGSTGATVTVTPLLDVSARYECWIDKRVTTDLQAKWATIQPWVIGIVQDLAGGGAFGLMRCAPAFHWDENRITADIEGVAPNSEDGGDIIQNILEITTSRVAGWEFVAAWTGDPEAALVFRGSQVYVQRVTRRWRQLGAAAKKASGSAAVGNDAQIRVAAAAPAALPQGVGGSQWFVLSEDHGEIPKAVGVGNYLVPFSEYVTTRVQRRVTAL